MGDIKKNSGYENSGLGNSGHRNSGNWNSGLGNSGDWNSGNWNSGNWNSGFGNSGNWNSGHENSGLGNSGHENSGYGNSCDNSSGIFCTKTPPLYCFNKPSAKSFDEIEHPTFEGFHLTEWIETNNMSDEEKERHPSHKSTGGHLRTYSWKEAWANYWRDSSEEERQKVLNLPNFDAKIFKEITGIDVDCSSGREQRI